MEKRRRVLLYGKSLILGTIGMSLQQYPQLEIVSVSAPLATAQELGALAPDVILFDVEVACPEFAICLLEARPSLLLIGIDPNSNEILLWSGQHLRAQTVRDVAQAINTLPGSSGQPARRASNLDWLRQLVLRRRSVGFPRGNKNRPSPSRP